MANEIKVNIKTKVDDKPILKLKKNIDGVESPIEKIKKKLTKMTDGVNERPIDRIKKNLEKLKNGAGKTSEWFGKLKDKIQNSTPIKGIDKLKSKLDELKNKTNQTGEKFGFLKGKIGSIIGAVAGIVSVGATLGFLKQSIDDYKADSLMSTKLRSNMNIVVGYKNDKNLMDKAFNEFKAEASKIQSKGVFGDELLVSAQAQLSTFQLTNKEINVLLPKIADIVANQKGMNGTAEDFYGTANMIGKAMSTGQLAPLRKVGIALTDAEMKQFKMLNTTERAAALQQILSKNVGNVNEALAQTDEGKIKQAVNAWGDMQEVIGLAAIKIQGKFAPYLTQLIPIVQDVGVKMLDSIGKGVDFIQSILPKINFTPILEPLSRIGGTIMRAFSSIDPSFIQVVFQTVVDLIGGIISFVEPLISIIAPLIAILINGFTAVAPVITPIVVVIGKIVGSIALAIGAFNVVAGVLGTILSVIGTISSWIALLTNPVGWVILAIGGLVAIWTLFKDQIITGIQIIGSFFVGLWNGFLNTGQNILNAIVGVFVNSFNKAKNVAQEAINGIKGFIDGLFGKIGELGNKIGGALSKLNPFKGKGGKVEIGHNYTGTRSWRGGLTTVAEKGAEMIKIPGQSPFLAGSEMLMNLPQGTEILTTENTQREMNSNSFGSMQSPKFKGSTTNNHTTNTENSSKEITFSPTIIVQNSNNDDDIESKINRVLNRFFEEKIISMGV